MQKIDISKKYRTRSGFPVEILKTGLRNSVFSVAALIDTTEKQIVVGLTEDGNFYVSGRESKLDLVEISPYEDFLVDEPVMVRDYETNDWIRAYFAGLVDGKPTVWLSGKTSWTTNGYRAIWNKCRRPTSEELS